MLNGVIPLWYGLNCIPHQNIQADFGDTVGFALDHRNKVNITIKQVIPIFGLPLHMKVMFTLYYSQLTIY